MNLKTEFVMGDENDILVNSGLLQFPYGIGRLDESRVQMNGENVNMWIYKNI